MPKPVISICVTLTMFLIGLVVLNKAVTVMKKDFDLAIRIRGGIAGREPVLQPNAMKFYILTRRETVDKQDPKTLVR